jgi:hypothetical protein
VRAGLRLQNPSLNHGWENSDYRVLQSLKVFGHSLSSVEQFADLTTLGFQHTYKVFENLLGVYLRKKEIPTLLSESVQFAWSLAPGVGADHAKKAIG